MKQQRRVQFLISAISLPLLGLGFTIVWMIYEAIQMEPKFTGGDPSFAYSPIPTRVLVPFFVGLATSIALIVVRAVRRASSAASNET
jgi:hypothetical protein